MIIKIKDYAQDDIAISYEEGLKCFQVMKKNLDNHEDVVLDFDGIRYVITAFFNPIIGNAILHYGPQVMKQITINNASSDIIDKIRLVEDNVLIKREDVF